MKQNGEKERVKVSRETLGKFFYDLARTCFAAMIIGAIVGFFKKDVSGEACVVLVTVGIFSTTAFASVGYYILKHK